MEITKAIEVIKGYKRLDEIMKNTHRLPACDMAIAALEKDIAEKPVYTSSGEVNHCPNCDYDLMGGMWFAGDETPTYCWECGQKLNWGEENE